MKRMVITLLVLAVSISFASNGISKASSRQVKSIEQQLQQLRKEKKAAEQKANEAINRIEAIGEEKKQAAQDLNTLMAQIDASSEQLMTIQQEINTSEETLSMQEKTLAEVVHHVNQRNDLIQSRLQVLYIKGSVPYLDVLLNAATFSDFLQRLDGILMIITQDKELLNMAREDQQVLEQKKQEIELLLLDLQEDYNELVSVRQNLLEKEKEKEVLLVNLEAEEEELEDYTKEQEDFLMEAARKEAELNKQKTSALKKKTEKKARVLSASGFTYPLPQTYRLTSSFGIRVDPVTGKKGAFHKGLDFGAPGGTKILASKEGTVLVAQFYGGYGNTVIIDHGGGTWTLYAHMKSINVRTGNTVKQGEVIGKVGSTGKSTGNHLHFEVRQNEQAVDPKQFINW